MAISVKSSGGGGLSSTDVTASSAQVLAGYTALTTDSNDEAKQGTIQEWGGELGVIITKPINNNPVADYTGGLITNGCNYSSDQVNITGQESGVAVGEYIARYTPQKGVFWSDGTSETEIVTLTINAIAVEMNSFSVSQNLIRDITIAQI